MIQIILRCSNEVRALALAKGFREQTVLVKNEAVMSTEANRRELEREILDLRPYQFLVSDFWGVTNG